MVLMSWSRLEFCREKAEECRALALASHRVERRQQYLELASMWDTLAIEAARQHFSEREPPNK